MFQECHAIFVSCLDDMHALRFAMAGASRPAWTAFLTSCLSILLTHKFYEFNMPRDGHMQAPRPRPPTLLQKLLAKDIHRERSHLLQAFRFIVANNFLLHADHAPVSFPAIAPPLPPEFDVAGVHPFC